MVFYTVRLYFPPIPKDIIYYTVRLYPPPSTKIWYIIQCNFIFPSPQRYGILYSANLFPPPKKNIVYYTVWFYSLHKKRYSILYSVTLSLHQKIGILYSATLFTPLSQYMVLYLPSKKKNMAYYTVWLYLYLCDFLTHKMLNYQLITFCFTYSSEKQFTLVKDFMFSDLNFLIIIFKLMIE